MRIGFGLGIGFLLAYALGQALLQSAQILTLVLLALFAAVSLEPVVGALRRVGFPRGLAVRWSSWRWPRSPRCSSRWSSHR